VAAGGRRPGADKSAHRSRQRGPPGQWLNRPVLWLVGRYLRACVDPAQQALGDLRGHQLSPRLAHPCTDGMCLHQNMAHNAPKGSANNFRRECRTDLARTLLGDSGGPEPYTEQARSTGALLVGDAAGKPALSHGEEAHPFAECYFWADHLKPGSALGPRGGPHWLVPRRYGPCRAISHMNADLIRRRPKCTHDVMFRWVSRRILSRRIGRFAFHGTSRRGAPGPHPRPRSKLGHRAWAFRYCGEAYAGL